MFRTARFAAGAATIAMAAPCLAGPLAGQTIVPVDGGQFRIVARGQAVPLASTPARLSRTRLPASRPDLEQHRKTELVAIISAGQGRPSLEFGALGGGRREAPSLVHVGMGWSF